MLKYKVLKEMLSAKHGLLKVGDVLEDSKDFIELLEKHFGDKFNEFLEEVKEEKKVAPKKAKKEEEVK